VVADLCLIDIDHVHFYVHNSVETRNWFMEKMGLQHLNQGENDHTHTEIVGNQSSICFVISSPINNKSPVSHYLNSHPSGIVDVAFCVQNLDDLISQSDDQEVEMINFPQKYIFKEGFLKIAKIKGWGSLHHTLIENTSAIPFDLLLPQLNSRKAIDFDNLKRCLPDPNLSSVNNYQIIDNIINIDHIVLNVPAGELAKAVKFYQTILGFQLQQSFTIKTFRSGLYSEALISPNRQVQFNINEPTSANSQIQEFLDANNGSGIQHLALQSTNILQTVGEMRRRGLSFLSMPKTYYTKLKQQGINGLIPAFKSEEWDSIESQEILVDCHPSKPESLLMQTFTKSVFADKTFFFEIIERRNQAMGFGEGNFQELFEAIEREYISKENI
jgi:4-hydroxyphenylpyruvate dioxygenase